MALKYSDSSLNGIVLNQREKLPEPTGFGNEIKRLLAIKPPVDAIEGYQHAVLNLLHLVSAYLQHNSASKQSYPKCLVPPRI